MSNIKRIYVEKKSPFAVEAEQLQYDLNENLGIKNLTGVRVLNRYDISGIADEEYQKARTTIFSEPPVDRVFDEEIETAPDERIFAVEYLPGQYDQRADSAAQCIQLITLKEKPLIAAARVIILQGGISSGDFDKIKEYLINPVDSREAALSKPQKLEMEFQVPPDVKILAGFINKTDSELEELRGSLDLAMSAEDFLFCREYFKEKEKRDPTITEIKMLDTYWSDHCRHTTFESRLTKIEMEKSPFTAPLETAYENYLQSYDYVYGDESRDVTLMKIATMSMKELRKKGLLEDLEVSGEINACSIIREVEIDGRKEEWLVMFKNETHNHPTEIEPYGGAATCLGGAIRDPLSGRAYVFQAMRVTGSGDPRCKIEDTLPGKLPQRKITREAAFGYSSYGNQIGVPTGQVVEFYNEGYVAKRMEVGAVIGAVRRRDVVRSEPQPGDVILLVGGRTGRDGIGGATGSSKEHTEESIFTAGAEVQKGNPPEERKLQRLFRSARVTRLIKKCNDFGAGGVSVAIGELAGGLEINLDRVSKKYEGLDGTELALSESQERMAVVVAAEDAAEFITLADKENLEAAEVAVVTADNRLKMYWRDKKIIDISREFIDTHGVRQERRVRVTAPDPAKNFFTPGNPNEVNQKFCGGAGGPQRGQPIKGDSFASSESLAAGRSSLSIEKESPARRRQEIKNTWLESLKSLDNCCQKGLVERFDSTVGANSVTLPFGGKYQLTPVEAMVGKIPAFPGDSSTATVMSFGFNPRISQWSPFHGAIYAVVEAAAKITAVGGDFRTIRASLQEYFEKLGADETRWGKPFSALLGAYYALTRLGIPAIGGKDSMSGSFKDLDVPPTLIAFAVTTMDVDRVVSAEFKQPGSPVLYVELARDENEMPDFEQLKKNYALIHEKAGAGSILAAASVRAGGCAEAVNRMCFGNRVGFEFAGEIGYGDLFSPDYGSILLEIDPAAAVEKEFAGLDYRLLGHTREEPIIRIEEVEISLEEALSCWQEPLEKIFPTRTAGQPPVTADSLYTRRSGRRAEVKIAKPRALIPVFPGTNCEYETEKALLKAGAEVDTLVFRNLSAAHIDESLKLLQERIAAAQIVALPGGFSAGDEPDGSGKFIAAIFRSPRIKEAVMGLLNKRDGLMLGICNGFQALIKLGLVPYGEIRDMEEESPILTFNRIGRHVSCMVRTRVTSVLSPWFILSQPGDVHVIPVSHGEGRFIAGEQAIEQLFTNGQVATQYVDISGLPSGDIAFNPNGSLAAIEGITSPDGRILGKMGHSERRGDHVARNVPGEKYQPLFASGVEYFK